MTNSECKTFFRLKYIAHCKLRKAVSIVEIKLKMEYSMSSDLNATAQV